MPMKSARTKRLRPPALSLVTALCLLTACRTQTPPTPKAQPAQAWTTLAPGLRIDTQRATVEFDGTVAMDCHNPVTPDVYLELLVCAPDTREHEALVVTSVPPSLIHAALLAVGLEPGHPGVLRTATPPTGDPVRVTLFTDQAHPRDITSWITDAPTRSTAPPAAHVFAGSRIVDRNGQTRYDADGSGVIVGLTTFGSETIAYQPLISPSADTDEPVWIADPRTVPAIGTPVRVRLSRVKE